MTTPLQFETVSPGVVRVGRWTLVRDEEGQGRWIWSATTADLVKPEVWPDEETEIPEIPTGACPDCGKPLEVEGYCQVCDA